jgi:hypothetical protein
MVRPILQSLAQSLIVFTLMLNGLGVPALLAQRLGLPYCLNQKAPDPIPGQSQDICAHGAICASRRLCENPDPTG